MTLERLQNAVMMSGYQSEYLVGLRGQAIDPDCKNVLNALSIAAPKYAALEGKGEYDIREVLNEVASGLLNEHRTKNGWNANFFATEEQNQMAHDIGEVIGKNMRSARRMSTVFKNIAEEVEQAYKDKQKYANSNFLFSELDDIRNDVKTPMQAVKAAVEKTKQAFEQEDNIKLQAKIEKEKERERKAREAFNEGGNLFGDMLPKVIRAYRLGRAYELGRQTMLRSA